MNTFIIKGTVQRIDVKQLEKTTITTVLIQTEAKEGQLIPFDTFRTVDCQEGDRVLGEFYVKGNEWQGKNYSKLVLSEITKIKPRESNGAPSGPAPRPSQPTRTQSPSRPHLSPRRQDHDDNLPRYAPTDDEIPM